MPLACSCDYDYEFEAGDWYYNFHPNDFEKLNTNRRKRCKSCGELININDFCTIHCRKGYPRTELEAKFAGYNDLEDALSDEASIYLAPHYLCEKCGEIFLNLSALGFDCISPTENMPELLKQYQHDYKPQKLKNNELFQEALDEK